MGGPIEKPGAVLPFVRSKSRTKLQEENAKLSEQNETALLELGTLRTVCAALLDKVGCDVTIPAWIANVYAGRVKSGAVVVQYDLDETSGDVRLYLTDQEGNLEKQRDGRTPGGLIVPPGL